MRTGVMCPKGIICQLCNRNRNCWRGDVHQHPLGDNFTNMMAEHMRARQMAACNVPRLGAVANTGAIPTAEPGAINAGYTHTWAGLPNFASAGIATTGQRQTSGHKLVSLAVTGCKTRRSISQLPGLVGLQSLTMTLLTLWLKTRYMR